MAQLKMNDFPVPIPEDLLTALNKIDEETQKLEDKIIWCQDHGFSHEAVYLNAQARARASVFIKVCNALGKYF